MINWIHINKEKPKENKRVLAHAHGLVFSGTYINNDIVLSDDFSDRGNLQYDYNYVGKIRAMKISGWAELPSGPSWV